MNRSSLLSRLFASSSRWRKVAVWAALLTTTAGADAFAQSPPGQVFTEAAASDAFVMSPDASGAVMDRGSYAEDVGVGGMGIWGRMGHIAGETVGREQSITHFELMPYVFEDRTMFFLDGRFFATNNGRLGGSGGGGLRHYIDEYNAVFGASAWYDHDDTRGVVFSQVGASFELLSEWLDIRTNLYKHTQRDAAELGTSFVAGSERFEEYRIVFDTRTRFATAADGLDMLFTTPVPNPVAQAVNLEASAGWYHFQAPDFDLDQVWGWRLRLDADWFESLLHTYVDFTSDRSFHSNVSFGAEINYYADTQRRGRIGHSQFNRMSEWVRRNYTVVAITDSVINGGNVAINPDNGLPYLVSHVRNIQPPDPNFPNFPAGDGTPEMPFITIDDGQNTVLNPTDGLGPAGVADIVVVHAGSVFNVPVQMNPNQQVLGEGVIHPIRVANAPFSRARPVDPLGTIPLPSATGGGTLPQLINVVGDAVVFDAADDNSVFAGFDIVNVGGNGIFVAGTSDVTIRDVSVDTATGVGSNGIELLNPEGDIRIENLDIANAEGGAVLIDGGAANINWFGGTVTNSSEEAVIIRNQIGGIVNLAGDNGTDSATSFGGLTITDTGGQGILIQDTSAQISFGRSAGTPTTTPGVSIVNSTSTGVRVLNLNNPGIVSFLRGLLINNAAQQGLQIESSTGTFTLVDDATLVNDLQILNRNSTGFDITNLDGPGQVVILGDTVITDSAAATPEAAIDFHNDSSGLVRFDGDITATNSTSTGPLINIGDLLDPADSNLVDARFEANGNVTLDVAPGLLGPAILVSNEPSSVQFGRRNAPATISIDPGSGTAVRLFRNEGPIEFNSSINVATSIATAIDVRENEGNISFGVVNVQDALLGVAPGEPAVVVEDNRNAAGTATVGFSQLDVISTGVLALQAQRNDSFAVSAGTINTDGGGTAGAINLVDNDILNVLFSSITAVNYGDVAINVVDGNFEPNPNATFRVLGGNVLGSGGLISGGELGANIENISTVSFAFQDYTDNTAMAIDVENAVDFELTASRFSNNGTVGAPNHHVRLLANVLVDADNPVDGVNAYDYDIIGNLFEDTVVLVTPDAMLHIEGQSGALGSNMNLSITDGQDALNNIPGFIADRAFALNARPAAVRVDWNGNLIANVERNDFELSTLSQNLIGLDIITRGTGFVHNVLFSENVLRSPDALSDGNTGVRMNFAGRTDLSILNNSLVDQNNGNVLPGFFFAGTNATGYDLSLRAANNNVVFDDNYIDINGDAGTGLLFTQINTSNVRIGDDTGFLNGFGNQIDLFDSGINSIGTERGIIFQTTFGTINLSGTQDNVIQLVPNNGAVFIDFQPPANSTGQIIINGTPQP